MFKICFNNQTHLISKQPSNYEDLLSKIHKLFGKDLPAHWILQYKDSDSDLITLETKADYQELLQELPKFGRTLKLFIVPHNTTHNSFPSNPIASNQFSSSSYSIIRNKLSQQNSKFSKPGLETKLPEKALENHQEQEEEKLDQPVLETILPQKESINHKKSYQLSSQNQSFNGSVNSELRRPTFKAAVDESEQHIEEDIPNDEEQLYEAKLYQYLEEKRLREEEREEERFRERFMKMWSEQLPGLVEMIKQQLREEQAMENISYIHEVQCNGCKRFPIVGTRHQCIVCSDFTLCEKCEESHDHMHPLAKLKKKRDQEFVKPMQQMNTSIINMEKSLKLSQSQRPKIEKVQSIILDPQESEKLGNQINFDLDMKTPRGSSMEVSQKGFKEIYNNKAPLEDSLNMSKPNFLMRRESRREKRKDLLESFKESMKAEGHDLKGKKGEMEKQEEVSSEVKQKAWVLQEFFGGDAERILKFVKENSGLGMNELGEKYLNFISG